MGFPRGSFFPFPGFLPGGVPFFNPFSPFQRGTLVPLFGSLGGRLFFKPFGIGWVPPHYFQVPGIFLGGFPDLNFGQGGVLLLGSLTPTLILALYGDFFTPSFWVRVSQTLFSGGLYILGFIIKSLGGIPHFRVPLSFWETFFWGSISLQGTGEWCPFPWRVAPLKKGTYISYKRGAPFGKSRLKAPFGAPRGFRG